MTKCQPTKAIGPYTYTETDPIFAAWLATMPFLKLDQTTPQTVDNGAPQFNKGIKIKENEWVYLDGL